MKKNICLLLVILLLTGCSVKLVERESFDSIIDSVLYSAPKLSNTVFDGYKFYLPRGAFVLDSKDYNLKIKDNDNSYYLYVDTIAYYYKTKKEHTVDNSIFYSRNLDYKDNYGYVDITKVDDKYFLEIMYNYAKIEAYITEDDLYNSFLDMCYILSTIKFNDNAINYKLNNKELETTSEEFDIFKAKKDTDDFLQYVEEFDKYEETSDKPTDEDVIDINKK